MDTTIVVSLCAAIASLLILYFIVKSAVVAAMKETNTLLYEQIQLQKHSLKSTGLDVASFEQEHRYNEELRSIEKQFKSGTFTSEVYRTKIDEVKKRYGIVY